MLKSTSIKYVDALASLEFPRNLQIIVPVLPCRAVQFFTPCLDEPNQCIVPAECVEYAVRRKCRSPTLRIAAIDRNVVSGVKLLNLKVILGAQCIGRPRCTDQHGAAAAMRENSFRHFSHRLLFYSRLHHFFGSTSA